MKQSSAEGRLVADITDVTIDVGENEETEYAWSPCLLFTKEEFFFVKRTPVEDAGPEKRAAMAASS
jgi:hypothetical protein